MKCKTFLMAGMMFLAVCLFACQPSDSNVQQAVNEKLTATPGVSAEVKEGVVTLNGEVPDEAAKMAAEDAVKGVNGVKAVTNNIMVQAAVPPPPPPPAATDTTMKKDSAAVK
ncbi:BON domain-containing protein [Chitinophaga filiformis]|uniref:BON domain-containing protein n=1 Tax=Chitinophaga filiformis TaxID=104663 RepID=A0ABY4I441_CHIFI|nr:BON domain-containing protein [Chitinophaga filiformis]UPK70602.1 BON domain-containing protein [Chitinophaga filiformis]